MPSIRKDDEGFVLRLGHWLEPHRERLYQVVMVFPFITSVVCVLSIEPFEKAMVVSMMVSFVHTILIYLLLLVRMRAIYGRWSF